MILTIRVANMTDTDLIDRIIAESARGLGRDDYTDDEIDAALGGIWGLDTQLVKDATYFIVEHDGEPAACGGWSYRSTLFGSDGEAARDSATLDPVTDPARIRAFFVLPRFARQGIGSLLIRHCENAARQAGFRRMALGATAPGLRLYATHGYVAGEPLDYDLGNGLCMVVVPMSRDLD